ncbi:MAG: EF-P beta-lysylation protein EpmB, partial [Pseudomonadales bacterium]|nr:EF-P beta-lysylation protein EpmB [Pseudomonadales bacterium]
MIPLSDVSWQTQSWQWHLANAVTDVARLAEFLQLDGHFRQYSDFPLMVPWPWLQRMAKSDPNDPLLLQVLPRAEETVRVPGYS